MRLGKIRVGRRAVSPVIATLLMIAIAVAASILVYVWSMGIIGTLQTAGGEQTKEQVILEAYDWTDPDKLVLYVRNTGSTDVTIAAVYVGGSDCSPNAGVPLDLGGDSDKIEIDSGLPEIAPGQSVTVKIVTKTGAVFSYSVVKGRAG
ncbi:MAG: archaellin/type IV pilin N-terminal domain-containing protein [Candidatus Bathyarchaeia archaeon]